MPTDSAFEQAIQALLDGHPLPGTADSAEAADSIYAPIQVIDRIGRAHRAAIFGGDVPLDPPVSSRWGHLEVRSEIGRGTSGSVYRAWDRRLAREVALKLLSVEGDLEQALEEGQRLARLKHAHVVKVFGADSHDGIAGIWMELVEGETLDETLARDGVFSPEETVLIGLDLAAAISAVHAAGLLHRDIKARNVLRERGGRVVLMDLSAGRAVDQAPLRGDRTGTPMYMAPEVLNGDAATARSDVYSLGVLLFRLLTGSYPLTAHDLEQLHTAHATAIPLRLAVVCPELPGDVASVVERACHRDAEARFASAADFEQALAEALRRLMARRAFVASPAARWWGRWRRSLLAGASATAIGLFAVSALWNATGGRTARRALGLVVPPRSPLYLTVSGGLGIVRGRSLDVIPYNPATASVIAVSSDLGVRTMPGIPPWTPGGNFGLDGVPLAWSPTIGEGLCCFSDGTTDGQFNYAARTDSTLLEPIGSRPLAPSALYRFGRDWADPHLQFLLATDGVYYGVTYSSATRSFWVTRRVPTGSVIEQWSRDGKHISTPIHVTAALFKGIAVDPRDGTLWVVRDEYNVGVIRLENFDTTGQHLTALEIERSVVDVGAPNGAEFEWPRR
jgi:hypothetical protein